MKVSITGTGTIRPEDMPAWDALFDAGRVQGEADMARLREQSRLSGLEVIYDLTMFDEEWSPAYRHDVEEPVAWVNNRNGERRAGSQHPAYGC